LKNSTLAKTKVEEIRNTKSETNPNHKTQKLKNCLVFEGLASLNLFRNLPQQRHPDVSVAKLGF
ncbi:MAG: hypothetical protein QME74_05530, partial [Candidatus Edwardsbacteria bacterium]|nr:hypothetical protein [Candidatus Edwardsbacteria bacterium]